MKIRIKKTWIKYWLVLIVLASHLSLTQAGPELTQVREDFAQLYQGLKVAHPGLFWLRSEAEYDAFYESSLKELDAADTELARWTVFQRFVAYGGVAHARIDFPYARYDQYRTAGGKALPVYFGYDEGWIIAEDFSEQGLDQGTVITHLNDIDLDTWFDRANQVLSSDTDHISRSILKSQWPLYFWLWWELQGEQPDRVKLSVMQDDKLQTVWVSLVDRETLSMRMESRSQASTARLRSLDLLPDGVAWLVPGPFYNAEDPTNVWDSTQYLTFIDDAFADILAHNTELLVVDVRNNPGGNNSFSDPMIQWFASEPFRFASAFWVRSSAQAAASNQARLDSAGDADKTISLAYKEAFETVPHGQDFEYSIDWVTPREGERYEGRVVVLVNEQSYSNAVSVAAIAQDYGFATVVGESTTDFATTYGAMETFGLPHTGLSVGFPKALIVRPSGDRELGPVLVDVPIDNVDNFSRAQIIEKIQGALTE